MPRPRLPVKRLLATALIFALPGLGVVAALSFLHVLAPLWALGAGAGCVLIAAVVALPITRDLAQLARYGDGLSGGGKPEPPELSGWAPAEELATVMRRIQRQTELRERAGQEGAVPGHQLFDALPQPLILLDSTRRVRAINHSARELVGGDPTGGDLATAIRDPRVLDAVDHTLAEHERHAVGFTIAGVVERYFWAEVLPFRGAGEIGNRVLIALYDLTERRQVERMRGDFVANVSHELRTPLATLIGFIETLRGPARDDAQARENFLELMQEQANRMSRLVRDLLSLSAIEMTEHALPQAEIDVVAVIERVVATLRGEAEKRQVALKLETEGPVGTVTGDDDQLTQLFQNLIDNAIKYGRKGGQVRIAVRQDADIPPAMPRSKRDRPLASVLRVAVGDEGEGIAAEHLPRLTERFYRVDPARSRAVGGTGLGLAIVKHIVNRHRGVLEIDSRQGRGSTFTVILPAARSSSTN